MELNKLCTDGETNFRKNYEEDSFDTNEFKAKGAIIKPAWKSIKLLQPHCVTYVPKQPNDNYSLVHIIVFLHGIGIALPWNMFFSPENVLFLLVAYFCSVYFIMPLRDFFSAFIFLTIFHSLYY